MARGWESKAVESQIESSQGQNGQKPGSTAGHNDEDEAEKKMERERQSLLLSRAYILHRIDASPNDRYTQSLRQALAEIDSKLAQLKAGS